jgi:hypothetical protein
MRWQHDELGVEPELHRLDQKFQDYGFKTDVWLIPSRDSHLELMSKSIDLLRSADNDRNLFVLYYGGHGRISSARQAEWTCGQGPDHASVDWSAIQSLFAKARSDVLILLDTCAAASSTMRSQYGTMEAIVACGFESRAAPPGEYSFTNTLIEVLDDWINKQTFSASCLHAEILFQLKLKETKKGREGRKLEWCTTPIHINYTADSKLPGIELCRRNIVPRPQPPSPSEIERPSTFTDVMDIDFDGSSTALSPLSSLTGSGEFQTPHVLIKIGLEPIQGPIDMKQCLRWLEGVPLLGKWAKIEGIYPSFSTLIVLSMPISVWNMLPDHPACTFIGYVTGPGFHPESAKAEGLSTEFLEGRLSNPSAALGPGEIAMAKQFPEPELPSAGRWSGRSLASNLTDDSGCQDPDEYQLQSYAELMPRGHTKSSNLTPKPKPKSKLKPLINTPKTMEDRLLDLKSDFADSVQSTALPTSLATQSLSDADDLIPTTCSRCQLYKAECRRETPHSICVFCTAVGNLNCEIFPKFK